MNNFAGELYNITPMLKMDGQFIDGEQASISCFDIIQSDASSLDLSCDNVTNIAHEENDDATLIRNVFTADLKDDNTICRCISNKSNSESMLNIHIFPCKFIFINRGENTSRVPANDLNLKCHIYKKRERKINRPIHRRYRFWSLMSSPMIS